LGPFPETNTRVRAFKPWYWVQATARPQRTGRSAWTHLNDSVYFMSPAGPGPSREVQQACGYPATTFQTQTQLRQQLARSTEDACRGDPRGRALPAGGICVAARGGSPQRAKR